MALRVRRDGKKKALDGPPTPIILPDHNEEDDNEGGEPGSPQWQTYDVSKLRANAAPQRVGQSSRVASAARQPPSSFSTRAARSASSYEEFSDYEKVDSAEGSRGVGDGDGTLEISDEDGSQEIGDGEEEDDVEDDALLDDDDVLDEGLEDDHNAMYNRYASRHADAPFDSADFDDADDELDGDGVLLPIRRDKDAVNRSNAAALTNFDRDDRDQNDLTDAEISSALLLLSAAGARDADAWAAIDDSILTPTQYAEAEVASALVASRDAAARDAAATAADNESLRASSLPPPSNQRVSQYKDADSARLDAERLARDRASHIALHQRSPPPIVPVPFAHPNQPVPYPDILGIDLATPRPPTSADLTAACRALGQPASLLSLSRPSSFSADIDLTDDHATQASAERAAAAREHRIASSVPSLPPTAPASPLTRGRPRTSIHIRGTFFKPPGPSSSRLGSPLSRNASGHTSPDVGVPSHDDDVHMGDATVPALVPTQQVARRSARTNPPRSVTPGDVASDSSGGSKRTRADVQEDGEFPTSSLHSLYAYLSFSF